MSKSIDKTAEIARMTDAGLSQSATSEGLLSHFSPESFFDLGFAEQKTIKIGDPEHNGIPAYIGELIGQGPDVEIDSVETGEISHMRSFLFHPLDTETMIVNRQISHRVVCSYQLNEAFSRILKRSIDEKLTAITGAIWIEKTSIQGGKKTMNVYRIFERYLAGGESLKKA